MEQSDADADTDADAVEWTSVTTKITQRQVDELEALFPDAPSDPERIRRAVWMVTNAEEIVIGQRESEPED